MNSFAKVKSGSYGNITSDTGKCAVPSFAAKHKSPLSTGHQREMCTLLVQVQVRQYGQAEEPLNFLNFLPASVLSLDVALSPAFHAIIIKLAQEVLSALLTVRPWAVGGGGNHCHTCIKGDKTRKVLLLQILTDTCFPNGVRFARACLAISKHSNVEAFKEGLDKRLHTGAIHRLLV